MLQCRQGHVGAVGAICRDQAGLFLGASAIVYNNGDPATLEAMAIREGLDLAADLHIQQIQLASDCKEVIEEIQSGSGATYGATVKEIKQQQSTFSSCFFS